MSVLFANPIGVRPKKTNRPRLLLATSMTALVIGSATWGGPSRADPAAMNLPAVSVNGDTAAEDDEGYKSSQPTVHKLTQSLANTPQTINAVPRQLMDDKGAITLRDALRDVPGISLAAGEFGAQGDNLTIRGFSARNDIFLDDMRDYGSYYRDPFDLDEIDVLKGPSSILFGRGTTGGAIAQSSKVPLLENFEAGTISFGTDGTKRATVDLNVRLDDLGPGAAFRISLMGTDGGVADRKVTENSRFGVAPSLALGIGTPTRFTLSYLHQTEYDVPDYGLPWLYQGPSGISPQIARPAPVADDNFYGFENGDFLRTNVDIGTAKIEHDFSSNVSFRDQLRYAHYVRSFRITEPQIFGTAALGASGTALRLAPGTSLGSVLVSRNQLYGTSLETSLDNQADVTVKFDTGALSHTLMAGIEIERETSDPVRNTTIGPYSTTPLLNPNPSQIYNARTYLSGRTNTTADSETVYATDTVKISPQWEVTGGIRFDRFDADYSNQTYNNPVTHKGVTKTSLSHLDEQPSYSAAIVYKPTPEGSIYFDYGTSFNPSAESLSLSTANANLDPETDETFELGTKWEVLEERLLVTASLFQVEQSNLRETDPNNSNFQILAGDAMSKGFEFQATGKITKQWQVDLGYAYTFSEITKSPQTDVGNRLANVPAHTVSLFTTYSLPWKLQIGGGFDYVSSRFASAAPRVIGGVGFRQEAPGYVTANLMAKYPVSDSLSLQVNIYNLANADYADLLHPSHVVPGAGRSALFTANFKL